MAIDLLTTIRAEIDARLSELRPLLAEHERLLSAEDALASEGRSAAQPPISRSAAARTARPGAARPKAARPKAARPKAARPARKRGRVDDDDAGQAILAALEHGSHTVAELVMVTAMGAPEIRHSLRRLRRQKAITKTDRDGKIAYALPT